MIDAQRLYAAAFLRASSAGFAGVWLGLHLSRLGFDGAAAGAVVAAGLEGGALAAVAATWRGDGLGRRRGLVALTVLSLVGALGMGAARETWSTVLAASRRTASSASPSAEEHTPGPGPAMIETAQRPRSPPFTASNFVA